MTFLQPFVLWGLPLVLLPILIHLLNRMRHRPQPWAAMRFLISATRSSVNNARLRQWLILLCRVVAVATLVLFVARPLAGGWLGWALSPAPDAILILLDRSASMEARLVGATMTKREQALQSLAQAARQFQDTTHLVLIDSALRTPVPLGRASALVDSPLTSPTDTAADWPALLAAALNWLIENRAGTAELWIASDLQRSNWQPEDARWQTLTTQLAALPQRVRVRLLTLEQPGEANGSLSLKELVRRSRGDRSELQFALDVQQTVRRTEPVPLTVNLDGARTQLELRMDGQALRWRNKLSLGNRAKNGWGSFELPADGNAQDNRAYFVYGAEPVLRSTIISAETRSARLLELAIGAGAKSGSSVVDVLPSSKLARAVWEDSTFLAWQEPLPTGALAQKLRAFIEEGGTVLFLPPGGSDPQRFEGVGWGEIQESGSEKPFRVRRWEEGEGPLAKSDEGLSLALPESAFWRRQTISNPKNILAAFDDGSPFLTRQTLGRGEVFFCASLPEESWSSLGEGPVLVPMMQRLLASGSRRLQQALSVACGELSAVDQARRWETVDSPVAKDIQIQAGVFRSGERLLAMNRPLVEDDPEVLDGESARRLFGGMPVQVLQERQSRTERLQGEVWRAFLALMLLFLIAEAVLMLPPRRSAVPGSRSSNVGTPRPVEEAVT